MSRDKLTMIFTTQIKKFSNDLKKILEGDDEAQNMLSLLNGVNTATPGILIDFFKSEVTDK